MCFEEGLCVKIRGRLGAENCRRNHGMVLVGRQPEGGWPVARSCEILDD